MFGLSKEDFENIKKLNDMTQEKQDEIIDKALLQEDEIETCSICNKKVCNCNNVDDEK